MKTVKQVTGTWEAQLAELRAAGIFPQLHHRVFLHGPPGTGKSTWAHKQFESVERIECGRTDDREQYSGYMAPTSDKGGAIKLRACLGPAARAFTRGLPLVLDEIDEINPALETMLLTFLDDLSIARLQLPNGKIVKPREGYCVICTSNKGPEALSPRLLDRIDYVIHAATPAEGIASKLTLPGAAALLRGRYSCAPAQTAREITSRQLQRLEVAAGPLGLERAAQLIFGDSSESVLASLSANS